MPTTDEILVRYRGDFTQIDSGFDNVEAKILETEKIGTDAFNKISKEASKAGNSIETVGQDTDKLKGKFSEVERSGGRAFKAIGDAADHSQKGITSIRNSVNQLSRELPAFTMNLNTGFQAISNNVPALVDSINQIKAANAQLAAEGKQTQSVLGAVASAVFSWQTALSVGITLLTAYGAKIIEYITGTEKATKATADHNKEIKEYADYLEHLNATIEQSVKAEQERNAQVNRGASDQQGIAVISRQLELMKARLEVIKAEDEQRVSFSGKKEEISNRQIKQEEKIYQKEQQIRKMELEDLRYLLTRLTNFGDERLKTMGKILNKENEITAAAIRHRADLTGKGRKKEWTSNVDQLKLDEELAAMKNKYFDDWIKERSHIYNTQQKFLASKEKMDAQAQANELNKISSEATDKQWQDYKNSMEYQAAADRELWRERMVYVETYFSVASQIIGQLNNLANVEANNQLARERKRDEEKKKKIEADFKQGLITQQQRDQQIEALEVEAQRRENEIRREQAEKEKSLAIFLGTIKASLAFVEAFLNPSKFPQAILAAAEVAIIAATPVPEFKDGVVDLMGPGTETSDSIHAKLSRGESVIKANATRSYRDELTAMNKSPLDYADLIEQKYIKPAIDKEKRKQADFASNIARSLAEQGSFTDRGIIKAIEKNRPASAEDIATLTKEVAKQNRFTKFRSKLSYAK